MKKDKLNKLLITTVFFAFLILVSNDSKAASITINTSKTEVSPGENFSVTVSVNGGAGKVNVSATNATLSKTELELMLQSSMTITCTAGNSGTISINANGIVADYSTEKDTNISATPKNVTIVQNTEEKENNNGSSSNASSNSDNTNSNPGSNSDNNSTTTTKSNNANVKMITTSPVDFSGFKPSKTSGYAVTVENEVDKIYVSVDKEDAKASVSLLNKTNSDTGKSWVYIAEGSNEIDVTVTSEDGKNQKKYTINVTRNEKEKTEEPKQTEESEDSKEPEENSEEEPMEEAFGLTELNIEGLKLNPQFQTDVYEYKVELKEDLEKLNIKTLATKANSEIEITGNENLQEGENIITIIVKGENEAETVAYQITVNKTLEKQEVVLNVEQEQQKQQEKMKKIIILSVAGGVILIIVISVISVNIKKSTGSNEGYIPYENLTDDYEDYPENSAYEKNDEIEEQIEDTEDEFYEEEPKKKKRSKGKRFK